MYYVKLVLAIIHTGEGVQVRTLTPILVTDTYYSTLENRLNSLFGCEAF